jgi:hypothetical protein
MNTFPELHAHFDSLDADLVNAWRLTLAGFDMTQTTGMPDAVFNAIAFAHANDLAQFVGTPEFTEAVTEQFGEFFAQLCGAPTISTATLSHTSVCW